MQRDPNRLMHEGTSQKQRFAAELDPSSAPIDGRTPEYAVAFARSYSAWLRFYDLNNAEVDDWQRFFSQDPLVRVACAAIEKVDRYRIRTKTLFELLKNSRSAPPETDFRATLGMLFSDVGTLARELDRLKDELDDSLALKATLSKLIATRLAPALRKLIAIYKGGCKRDLIDTNATDPQLLIFDATTASFQAIGNAGLSKAWITGSESGWAAFHAAIEADESLYAVEPGQDIYSHLATHNLFASLFDLFLKAFARTVADANAALPGLLTGRNDHQPHYGLFLAFLQLMEHSREHLNTLTGRHLDHYYKEVLQLRPNTALAGEVHLLFELAKNRDSALLAGGTIFQGKNAEGKTVRFALNEPFVPNKASVDALMATGRSTPVSLTASKKPGLYAWPVMNSADGAGAELTTADGQWHPFINATGSKHLATAGFVIASHYLLLREGKRTITLTLEFAEKTVSEKEFCNSFEFYLSGQKEWCKATIDTTALSGSASSKITIPLTLDGSMPAVVPMSEAEPGNGLPPGLPMLKAVLKQDEKSLPFETLQKLHLDPAKAMLDVRVGYGSDSKPDGTGLKNLAVSNKFGELKTDKPFQPFGATPETGDALIIGSDELFQKKGASFQLRIVWKGLPFWRGHIDFDWVNEFYPKASLSFLKEGSWPETADKERLPLFRWKHDEVTIPESGATLPEKNVTEPQFDTTRYTLDSRCGFMKLSLEDDFGHQLYPLTLSRYLVRKASGEQMADDCMSLWKKVRYELYVLKNGKKEPKDPKNFTQDYIEAFSGCLPVEPYTPLIETLTLSYRARVALSGASLYHLTPFGSTAMAETGKPTLLYPFNDAGEFYIGIRNLQAGSTLSLLFQLAEGSAAPTVAKPEEHIRWSWLCSGEWEELSATGLSDSTAQLTRSGIIRFAVPALATSGDALLGGEELHWLRATVKEKPEAVCKIVSIAAQAARATQILPADSATAQQNEPLAAGTISKAVTPDAAIKKITQPYATFGGRAAEHDTAFRTRVSERLRHRNRAITMWDYERLVLEAFPNIYKVKCLNHTQFEPNETGTGIYRELAPGHVTIVTIPNLRNSNAIDPLRPYTSLGDLALVRTHLEAHASDLATLHVQNPVFEAVQTDFRVRFLPGFDENFHLERLRQELMRHLSPWAFEEGADITFGGKIHKSTLIDFVEERAYVDYVTDFRMYHIDGNQKKSDDTDEAEASLPISILVSVEAARHLITAIADEQGMSSRKP
ncbi:MAG: baseplate J/gp47 family protein [Chlorobiaceae bacterium]|nr:baseplate J/gp47 family protein [Chlorobiaceae bacterium]